MFKFFRIMLAILAAVALSAPAFAQDAAPAVAKLTLGENMNIELHYLLQVQGNAAETWVTPDSTKPDEKERETYSKDFQVRRSRLILKGMIAENLSFFMETDDIKFGSQGNSASLATTTEYTDDNGDKVKVKDTKGVFTQDAFINYKVANELEIAAGQILLPFMHHNRISAVKILGVDYNSSVIPLATSTNVWRDTGVEFRGLLMNGLIDYRVGIFQGVQASYPDKTDQSQDINPNDNPRYCGRVQVNLADAENEFFYSDNYLGTKNILSFGVGVDKQGSVVRDEDGKLADYMAYTVDVTVDRKMADMVLTVHGAYVNVKNQPGKVEKQNGYFAEAGLLIGKIQPLVKYVTWVEKEANTANGDDIEKTAFTAGVNYFLKGHNANIKGEVVIPMSDDLKDTSGQKQVNVQCQIFI